MFSMRMSRIERSHLGHLPLLWPVRQSGAAVKHNDVTLTLGLLSKQHIAHTPTIHVFFDCFQQEFMAQTGFNSEIFELPSQHRFR